MADKPDLSDLKARLGLTSPSSASLASPSSASAIPPANGGPPGPSPAGPPGAATGPRPGGPPVSAFPGPISSASQLPGPSSASQHPAPQAAPPRQQQAPQPQVQQLQPARQERAQQPAPKLSMAAQSTEFESMSTKTSPKFIIGAIIAALVGAVFGYSAASVMNNRQLVDMRKADAAAVQTKMKERVASFKKAHAIIKGLSGNKVEYDLAKQLNEIDFQANVGVFASNRLLLGGEAITKITQFTTDSASLAALIKDHDRSTNKVDTEEIKKLLEKNTVLKQQLGVIYDYRKAAKNVDKEGYLSKAGQLAQYIKKSKENKNKVIVKVIGGSEEVEIDSRQFIRVRGKDVLRVNGKNALSRYEFRIKNLQYKAATIAKYVDSIDLALGKITDGGDTPTAAPAAE